MDNVVDEVADVVENDGRPESVEVVVPVVGSPDVVAEVVEVVDSVVGSGIGGKVSRSDAPNDDVGLKGFSPENPVVCGWSEDKPNDDGIEGGEPGAPESPLENRPVPVVCDENVEVDVG